MPAHMFANWSGHTVQVQDQSYAQVDDHHFDRSNNGHAKKVPHIVAQQVAANCGIESQEGDTLNAKPLLKRDRAQKKHSHKTVLSAPERGHTAAL